MSEATVATPTQEIPAPPRADLVVAALYSAAASWRYHAAVGRVPTAAADQAARLLTAAALDHITEVSP